MAEKIKGKKVTKPEKEHAQITLKIADLVQAVNGIMNPGGPIFDWFEGYPDGKAAIEIRNGEMEIVNDKVLMGGAVDGQSIYNLKVVGYDGRDGGVYCEGEETDCLIDNAYITLEGTGKGVGGPDTGVSARNGATVTIKNAVINGYGRSRFCTTAETGSKMYVYDSVLWSHGQPWGEGFEPITEPMATPPAGLLIEGNCRTHCTMTNSYSYFYNSKIICDGWGALSTEGAEGYVYLEANDCDVIVTKRGYGAYADPDCHDYFNNCNFDVADMSLILAGKSDATFKNCVCENGTYFALIHNVNGLPEEVGELNVEGGEIHAGKELILCRSENAEINFKNCAVSSDEGVILRTAINDDPCSTVPSKKPYGVRANFEEMKLEGDFIHEDKKRNLYLNFKKSNITGAIKDAIVEFDDRTCWFATGNSTVTFASDFYLNQIDAAKGVTIKAKAGKAGTYKLLSGGKLVVTEK